jgi:hypothetical protein
MGLNKVDEVAQERALGPHVKPERFPDTDVGVKMERQHTVSHGTSPIQGKATGAKASRSNLA